MDSKLIADLKNNLANDVMLHTEHDEMVKHRPEGEYQRDYCRVLYSNSFRRLQGKMQLFDINNEKFYRNRLTHSLEVMQIASSIANMCKYSNNEIFVIQAGALAHDIGNPPFGHSGERKLNEIYSFIGGFEGNAQSLRVLRHIEKKSKGFLGLNLTFRTQLSIVKYFCRSNYGKNHKFLYDEDYDILLSFINDANIKIRTLDVQIVDLADEIAYATHDLEDGLANYVFSISDIVKELYKLEGNSTEFRSFIRDIETSEEDSGVYDIKVNLLEYQKLFAIKLQSILIHKFLEDIDLIKITDEEKAIYGASNAFEIGLKSYKKFLNNLKLAIYNCVIIKKDVIDYEKKGDKLLEFFANFLRKNTYKLPDEYKAEYILGKCDNNINKDVLQERLICDYISGMMESHIINQYELITGKSFENILFD